MVTIQLGDDVTARVEADLGDGKWRVHASQLPSEVEAVLNSRTARLYQQGDTETLWVYDVKRDARLFLLSDSGFGRLPISDRMRPRYMRALREVVGFLSRPPDGPECDAEALSEVKGILNRCVRKDQWDWLAVYRALGHPPVNLLRLAATHIGSLARAVRTGDKPGLRRYAEILVDSRIRDTLATGLANIRSSSPRLDASTVFASLSSQKAEGDQPQVGSGGDPYIVSQVARAKLERANRVHANTLDMLVKHLQQQGFLVESSRLVDAYCRLKTGPAIFEVKSITADNERSQCRHALSQLYEYRYLHSVPDASLWLVLSRRPDHSWLVDYLHRDRGVGVLWVAGTGLEGPGKGRLHESWTSEGDQPFPGGDAAEGA